MSHTYTNRLVHETSPYLLQHAHNPVDWHSWGEEALKKARAEDKPILLSVGYAACHWCHVMERESFEDPRIAQVMNEHFVCVKVDREERPDLDRIYQSAVQMMGVHGGWPLTAFLTPDGEPFYGGTYFPPDDRHGLPSFTRILLSVSRAWREDRDEVRTAVGQFLEGLNHLNRFPASSAEPTAAVVEAAVRSLSRSVDPVHGGFGRAPKFPHPSALELLLRAGARGDRFTLDMVTLTLRRMAEGGIYDQVGGGFHRYSVDARWLVPHFEKMLYDNAQLIGVYVHAHQVTGEPIFARIARETIGYVLREMTHPDGGFYSTQDADSEGEEGKFFVWTKEEVLRVLEPELGELCCRAFDVSEAGNFEHGKSILHVVATPEQLANRFGKSPEEIGMLLGKVKCKLFGARDTRVKPGRDEKILTAWNGLMISACAAAGSALGHGAALEAGVRAAEFIERHLTRDGRLLRTWTAGEAKLNGYLDDYAFLTAALLDLYEATLDPRFFRRAEALHRVTLEQFWDEAEGGFFFTAKDHERLVARMKSAHDEAIPSGTAVATLNLLRFASALGEEAYGKMADRVFRSLLRATEQSPSGFGHLLLALDFAVHGPVEVVLVGPREAPATRAMLEVVHRWYLPNRVLAHVDPAAGDAPLTGPLAEGKRAVDGKVTAYVCRGFTCSAPVTDPEALGALLEEGGPEIGAGQAPAA
ncbi:MAG: thioredoxin domain-containing protein [candidate division NC10 bacterium]|nr:thioredoxin domain-containing protein [candidate division NC10 bacterium]